MAKVPMIAKQKHRYGRNIHRPGDRFDATLEDSRVLAAVGYATRDLTPTAPPPAPAPAAKRVYQRRDMRAAAAPAEPPAPEPPPIEPPPAEAPAEPAAPETPASTDVGAVSTESFKPRRQPRAE